jgi:[protein-PII] uridylyltransferase
VGGLGREEQGMHSDLDILFLTESKEGEEEALKLLKQFWDRQWKLGYSIRSLKNVWKHAKEDPTFFTAVIESRFLAGEREVFHEFESQKQLFFQENRSLLFQEIYPEVKHLSIFEKEHKIFLNQPHLKNSPGGLRGFQMFHWMSKLYPEYEELRSKEEYRKALKGYYHLWAVRNIASISANRSVDQLQLNILAKILEQFGQKEQFAAEEFLKKIFISSSAVYNLLLRLKESMEEALPLRKKFFLFFKKKKQDATILVLDQKVYVKEKSAVAYLRGILYAVKAGFKVAEETLREARTLFHRKKEFTSEEIQAFQQFFDLETKLYSGFYYLYHVGFLGAFFPHYRETCLRPQLDYYHSFTLGEHSLLTLKFLSRFYHLQDNPFSRVLYELNPEERETLIYSLLLHDIGKIREGDHIENNRQMIDAILDPVPLKTQQKEDVAFLVIQHLVMSQTCQNQDINRIKVILSFSEKVGSVKRLKMLFLLTICDMMAVNDKPVSSFIEAGLVGLYFKTSIVLSEGEAVLRENEKEEIVANLEKKAGSSILSTLKLLPDEYLYEVNNQDILRDVEFLRTGKCGVVAERENSDILKIKFYGKDEKGILSQMVATLTLNYLNILDARVYTLKNQMILDYFYCSPIIKDQKINSEFLEKLREKIEDEVFNEGVRADLKTSFYNKLHYWIPKNVLSSITTRARFHTLDDDLIYLSLGAQDFPGILYFITDFLKAKGFSVLRSKINTVGIRVYDGFYLKNESCMQPLDEIGNLLEQHINSLRKEVNKSELF